MLFVEFRAYGWRRVVLVELLIRNSVEVMLIQP